MEKQLKVSELQVGMYVSRLDRPWLETPFLIQGIRINNKKDIDILNNYCKKVYIDTEKTRQSHGMEHRSGIDRRGSMPITGTSNLSFPGNKIEYVEKTTVKEELGIAKKLNKEISSVIREIMDDAKYGRKINTRETLKAVRKMKESILRNPNAFMLLRLIKDKDTYTYSHCLHVSGLCIAFGRHLGLSSETLDELAIGALLSDIGKLRLPSEILNKPDRLTEVEFEEVKKHVVHSIEIMEEAGNMNRASIEIAATHHERFDGSGYLRGMNGPQIPVLGRVAAIADCYDAMTSDKIYKSAISPYEAIRQLYGMRDVLFQDSLVENFIQMIGIYPTGAIVELSTGQVGIVISQNQLRRLRPTVMLVLDMDKQPMDAAPIIDLHKQTEDSDGNPLEIIKELEPGTFNVDPKEYFL